MAWALEFDGVNDHLLLDAPLYIQDGETIDLNIIQDNSTGYEMWLSTWESNPSFNDGEWYFGKLNTADGRLTLYNRFTTGRNNSDAGVLVVGEDATFSLQRNGNTLRALKNGVEVIAPLSFSAGHLDLYPIKRLMKENESGTSFCFTGQLKSATFGNRLNLDATASSHTTGQPVITDTIGGNNATGVNFPVDGSAWVDLGGGAVTYDIDLATLNSSSQFNAIDLLYNRQLSINTLNSSAQFNDITLSYLQSITLDLGTLESTGQFDDLSIQYNRVINLGELSASGQFNSINFDYIQNGVTYQLTLDALNSNAQFNDINIAYNRVFNLSEQSSSAYFGDLDLTKGLLFALNSLSSTAQFNQVQLLHNKVLSISELSSVASFKSIQLDYSGFVEQLIDTYTIAYAPDLISVNYQDDSITVRYKD